MVKKQGGLRISMLKMTLIPVLILGLVIMIFSSKAFSAGIDMEVESGLKNLAVRVADTYNDKYPGDYKPDDAKNLILMKGGQVISDDFGLIDRIKEESGADVTLFYSNVRILTTLTDDKGERRIGTGASERIKNDVLVKQKEHFYHNVIIDGTKYFAFYMPLFNSDGTCVGMIGVAKPASNVAKIIQIAILIICVFDVLCILIAAIFSIRYTSRLVKNIGKIKAFLGQIAAGNLNSQIDPRVLKRNDELGEMGEFIVTVQESLRELVEFDTLTGLYNRHSGEQQLRILQEKCEKTGNLFSVAIGDIDFFKKFNETYGHECGDNVLKCVSMILKNHMDKKGFASRWGGEEFLIVFEKTGIRSAEDELQNILEDIRNANLIYKGQQLNITMTIGVTEGNEKSSLHQILMEADEKLYQGKLSGRNKIIR